jgi:hypothetical protein
MSYNISPTYLTQGVLPVHPGILYGQNERLDELNTRLYDRVIPKGAELQPNFDPRPVSTKYGLFPMLDGRSPATYPIQKYRDYSIGQTFAPITTKGPVDGFFANVDTESLLRSQFFALQRDAGQTSYIPGSQSDLYKTPEAVGRQESQPYEGLFRTETYSGPNTQHLMGIGENTFGNNTRTQMCNEYTQTIRNRVFM